MTNRRKGFTLVELLIAVTIVGILAAIAVPSYRQYVIRVNRTDAKVGLMSTAQNIERCFTRTNSYADALCIAAAALPRNTERNTYTLAFLAAPTATAFTLTATPINGQAADTACGTFRLDQLGVQTVTGTKPPTECW